MKWLACLLGFSGLGSIFLPTEVCLAKANLAEQFSTLRDQVSLLEQGLLQGLHSQESLKNQVIQIKKIQKLLKLQKQERLLGQKRLTELERTVQELESRRGDLNQRVEAQQQAVRKLLVTLDASQQRGSLGGSLGASLEQEKLEAPRRKVIANLVDRGLKEVESLRVDIEDASRLEVRIQEEKQQLTYLFHDLREQASVLELNRQLKLDFLKRKQKERLHQLENYQRLKNAEAKVETLIGEFNERREVDRLSKAMKEGSFYQLKGKLPFPVLDGKVVGAFGKAFDSRSGLYVFRKGVNIATQKNEKVKAISTGKIAFSGQLPNYGQVVIIDHGDHYYSICGHLGAALKKTRDPVRAGEPIGITGDSSTPLYFEIRSRNVAVNPLQWVFN